MRPEFTLSELPGQETRHSDWQNRAALITGGLGFIGSTLAIRLSDLRARVTVIDSLIPEYGGNLHNLAGYEQRVRVNLSDIRDRFSLEALLAGQEDLQPRRSDQPSRLDAGFPDRCCDQRHGLAEPAAAL